MKYKDKNGDIINFGDKVITKDGYTAFASMFGEDYSETPKPRILVSLTLEGENIIARRKKAYYPHELEKVKNLEVSSVECDICSHKWIAIRPVGLKELECPNCNNVCGFENLTP